MKVRFLIFAFVLVSCGFVGSAHASIEMTPFDIEVNSEQFYEPNLNKFQLVMEPGQSQKITIMITNTDSKTHTINLQMAKDAPRPERHFVFEPNSLVITPGETVTSLLTVSASDEASTGTTIWHTLIAKSTTFGTKSFGFYLEVAEEVSTPSREMIRRGHPGSMFPENTQFDISEDAALNMIPYDFLHPKVPEGYSFQGVYGEGRDNLIYAKQDVTSDIEEFEFWDNGGLLIEFNELKELSFDDYLNSLSTEEQQVRINGKNSIAIQSKLIGKSEDGEIFSSSRVTVFLEEYQLRLTSQMPLEQLLRTAESMIVSEETVNDVLNNQIPYSVLTWGDTPTLHIYGESASIHHYPYVEFHQGELDWLDRVIENKVTLMTKSDISQYLELIGNDDIHAKYIDSDGFIKYYALRLSDPSLNLDEHNVRAFYQNFEPKDFSTVNLDEDEIPQYLRYILDENEWTVLSDTQYQELSKQFHDNSGNYRVLKEDNAPSFWHLSYIGPELDEVKQGIFENRETEISVEKSMFDILSPPSCTSVKSNNQAYDVYSEYERFSVTDWTGDQIRRISHGESVIVEFNPFNDWAENSPYVFEFTIEYFDGEHAITLYSDTNTITGSLCDVTQGFRWEFVPEPGSYEVVINRINSGDDQDYDRNIQVDKFEIYNAPKQDPEILDRMSETSFVDTLYKISSAGPGGIGVNIEEVEWSPDGSFILFKQHDRCHYIDDPHCVSESLWKLNFEDKSIQKIPLTIFEDKGSIEDIKISPNGGFLAMKGSQSKSDGDYLSGLFVYDFEDKRLDMIIDRTKTHVTSFDWLPDNTLLYHESITQNGGVLWKIDREGNKIEKIYEGEPNFGYMDVSPDGTKISFRALEKEPGRSPPPSPEDFDPPGTITWFDIPTKEFFKETITPNIYSTSRWSPDNNYLYYLGIRPSAVIGKLDVNSGEDTPLVISVYPIQVHSTFSLNPEGNLLVFGMHKDQTFEYDSILVMDLLNPSPSMLSVPKSPVKGITCGIGTILLNEECVSETFAKKQGCTIVDGKCITEELDDIRCGPGTELVDGVCVVIKTDGPYRSSGDCLIATASFGSSLSPQVQMLREIRDNTLLSTYSGSAFMNGFNFVYYSFSPTIAQWENENPTFKETVKLFITPMISALSIMTLVDEGSEIQVVLYGITTIGLIVGMYVVAPVSVVLQLKKRR